MSSRTSQAPDAPAHPAEGDVLAGKYRVERVLGAGGMGVVVSAMHLSLDERVALKFLLPTMASPEALGRFSREARAAAKIKSEHVARVTDVGTLDSGAPYMVMEYLEGSDLGKVLAAQKQLPIRDAVEHILQACDAVAEAHSLGIVHRDLKPSNLFLARRPGSPPVVKVLDFGISKITVRGQSLPPAESGMEMTRTRAWLGSPLYMSPEQMKSPRDVDARGDIWALGVILFELLAGKTPFDAETFPELCAQIMHGDPTWLEHVRPDAPAALGDVIRKCLEKDPAKRWQTVADLVLALVEFAPRRARSVAERAVAVTEAAGLRAVSQPRLALDGTLPEPQMSPFRTRASAPDRTSAPPARDPTAAVAATSLEATPAPQTGREREREPFRGATATAIGLALVVVAVLAIGFYLRQRAAASASDAPPEDTVVASAPPAAPSAIAPTFEPPPPPIETAPVATATPTAAPTAAVRSTASTAVTRAAARDAGAPSTSPAPAPQSTAAPIAPATAQPGGDKTPSPPSNPDIGNERCFATQPDGSKTQVPCH